MPSRTRLHTDPVALRDGEGIRRLTCDCGADVRLVLPMDAGVLLAVLREFNERHSECVATQDQQTKETT